MTVTTSSTQMDHIRKETKKQKHAAFEGNELLRAIKDHFSLVLLRARFQRLGPGAHCSEEDHNRISAAFGRRLGDTSQNVHHNQIYQHVRRVKSILQLQASELPHSDERKPFPLSVYNLASTISCERKKMQHTNTHRRKRATYTYIYVCAFLKKKLINT